MLLNLVDDWQMILDGLQIFLCFLIVVFLVSNRRKSKKLDKKLRMQAFGGEFNSEVMLQSIKQQADQIFDSLLHNINSERQNMERLFKSPRLTGQPKPALINPARNSYQKQQGEARFTMGQHISQVSKTDERQMITDLAAKGMSAADIATQLKVPMAEVELLLKISQKSFQTSVEGNA